MTTQRILFRAALVAAVVGTAGLAVALATADRPADELALPVGIGPTTANYIWNRKADWPKWERQAGTSPDARYLLGLSRLYDFTKPDRPLAPNLACVRTLEEAAGAGSKHAAYALAKLCATGRGAAIDPRAARLWLREAAHMGLAEAQLDLGDEYDVADDQGSARGWWFLAASGGNPTARRLIVEQVAAAELPWDDDGGLVLAWARELSDDRPGNVEHAYAAALLLHYRALDDGKPEGDDAKLALRYYRRAAAGNLGRALFRLSQAYLTGFGTEPDAKEAVAWLRKAADTGHPLAMATLGEVLAVGAYGSARDADQARRWVDRAAATRDADALAVCAHYHAVHREDLDEAEKLYRRAADAGHVEAQVELAWLLLTRPSKEAEQRQFEGKALLLELQRCHEFAAIARLGRWHARQGEWKEAAGKFLLAATVGGRLDAQYQLALCFLHGRGVEADALEAFRWLRIAAENVATDAVEEDWAAACFQLAKCYEDGTGTRAHPDEAVRIYRLLEQAGHAGARQALKRLGK